jgi:hypothetical protein
MFRETPRIGIALAFAAFSAPTPADECAALKSAMLHSGHTPHTAIITKTDAQGKQTVTRQVQTVDNKYVQLPDGKWYAMNIAIKDLDDNTSDLQTCRGLGSDRVSGEPTVVYAAHMTLGEVSEQKFWVSAQNLVVKSAGVNGGSHYTIEYDFAHATPPANALSMGGK